MRVMTLTILFQIDEWQDVLDFLGWHKRINEREDLLGWQWWNWRWNGYARLAWVYRYAGFHPWTCAHSCMESNEYIWETFASRLLGFGSINACRVLDVHWIASYHSKHWTHPWNRCRRQNCRPNDTVRCSYVVQKFRGRMGIMRDNRNIKDAARAFVCFFEG